MCFWFDEKVFQKRWVPPGVAPSRNRLHRISGHFAVDSNILDDVLLVKVESSEQLLIQSQFPSVLRPLPDIQLLRSDSAHLFPHLVRRSHGGGCKTLQGAHGQGRLLHDGLEERKVVQARLGLAANPRHHLHQTFMPSAGGI